MFIVTVHVAPETVSHPLQLAKVDPLAALAVRVTFVPLAYGSEQSVPQLIPAGFELTVPVPVPARMTDSVNWLACPADTVSVVLPIDPPPSVAVIVVVPAFTPVARPAASMVATAVLLLLHVTPVARIVTGVEESVLVPFPNWPQSLMPQHRTVVSPRSAQLWCHHPAVTATAPLIPLTVTWIVEPLVVPFPSCPNWFCPQQWTVPLPRSAQVWSHPALTATAPAMPATCTGVAAVVVVPLPSCPDSLSPQHRTVPSLSTAHV